MAILNTTVVNGDLTVTGEAQATMFKINNKYYKVTFENGVLMFTEVT